MKMKFTKMLAAGLILTFGAGNLLAQEEVTYTLDPSDMDVHDEGYYKSGITKEVDGQEKFFNGCDDEYGDANHNETGEQQNFYYENVMIMPDCPGKGTPPEGVDNVGYVQITKHKDAYTDSASFGYIMTPGVTDIRSLEVHVGTDLSVGNHRRIFMAIQSSNDGGETWGIDSETGWESVIELTEQGGNIILLEPDGDNVAFNNMVADSRSGTVHLRILPVPTPGLSTDTNNGERLKIFRMELQASEGATTTSVAADFKEAPFFTVQNKTFVSNQDKLSVYTITGAFVGSGKNVSIPSKGMYIVRSTKGKAVRIGIQ